MGRCLAVQFAQAFDLRTSLQQRKIFQVCRCDPYQALGRVERCLERPALWRVTLRTGKREKTIMPNRRRTPPWSRVSLVTSATAWYSDSSLGNCEN